MRKLILIIPVSLILLLGINQCEKAKPINIVLYDKPLETIQYYIQGKWRVVYGKGGICGSCIFPCDNCYVDFTSDNRFISESFATTTDTTTIHWIREKGRYIHLDSTYVMTFVDKYLAPHSYVIERINYDTLVYYDNATDPLFYNCVRLK
jgi:hypothetical protein